LRRYKKAHEAQEMGRDDFKGQLKQLAWRQAQNSVTMTIFLLKQWCGYTEKREFGGLPGAPPIGLSVEHERGLDALILAAQAANKQKKDEKDADKG
jgi:hypothetical protein